MYFSEFVLFYILTSKNVNISVDFEYGVGYFASCEFESLTVRLNFMSRVLNEN
jgi:hypothetical protein